MHQINHSILCFNSFLVEAANVIIVNLQLTVVVLAAAVQALPSLFAYHLQYLTAELLGHLTRHINLIICVKISLFILIILHLIGGHCGSFRFKAAPLFLVFLGQQTANLA